MHVLTDSVAAEPLLAAFVSRSGRDDPYPVYRELLALPGLPRLGDGSLMITRFADCSAVLRSPDVGHSDDVGGARVPDWRDHPSLLLFGTSLLGLDPPAHTRLRRIVSGAFTPRRTAALRPAVTAVVHELLEKLSEASDFISAFAFPLPIAVIGELLGVPRADQPPFQRLARDWTHVLDVTTPRVLARADQAAVEIRSYLGDLADERRVRPRDDLMSALVADPGGLDPDEVVTMAALLFAAGFETATHLLGNGLVALLGHPDQLQRWRSAPDELAEPAVDELLRFDSPVQIARRKALRPLVIGDTEVAPGEKLTVCLGAANRDSARFTDPDRLDLARAEGGSLAFGAGIHYCLGAPLARLEGQVAFPALFRRYPRLALAGPGMRRVSLTLRGYQRLPVTTG
ncbi:cytochrome P450 [Nakamurella sp.]|uniref:cytochrome P450 n=1 Tax=Nakamurella sp. TaxID=1869182 RepID=UPI0037834456